MLYVHNGDVGVVVSCNVVVDCVIVVFGALVVTAGVAVGGRVVVTCLTLVVVLRGCSVVDTGTFVVISVVDAAVVVLANGVLVTVGAWVVSVVVTVVVVADGVLVTVGTAVVEVTLGAAGVSVT